MKALKIFSVIALAALLVIGWATFTIGKGTEAVSYKSGLSEADKYVEEGLYQRAILKYKEALQENNSEKNWAKMFKAYELRSKEDPSISSEYITDLEAALALYPKNTAFVKKLCEQYESSRELDKAYKCILKAIENGVKDEEIIAKAKELKYSFGIVSGRINDFKDHSAGIYCVFNGEKWGYIDTTGDELSDFQYPFVGSANSDSVRVVHTRLGCRLIDGNNMVMGIFKFDITDAGLFADGLIPVCNEEGKYSYYDAFAKEKFGDFEYAGTFQNGIAAAKNDGKWFLINTSGKKISDEFAEIIVDDNGLYLKGSVMVAAKEEGKYQLFDKDGKSISKFSASKMDRCNADGVIAFEKDGKWGFVDATGKEVIKPAYDEAKSFFNGLAAVCKDGKWGFINSSNEVVIECQFADADYFNAGGSCMVRGDSTEADDPVFWQLLVLNFGV